VNASPTFPLHPREPRFAASKVNGGARVDERCQFLMFRGRMAVLRGFHAEQRPHIAQPMPPRGS
jgi:hypothetical protein